MRKLVHIEKINEILPIEGADKIELVKVLSWQCIAKKGEFKVGDLCVYHEIDSVCPETDNYEFLRSRKFRIRTIKMKGELSQGLALPISILPEGNYEEGQDVTELSQVKHYDPENRTNLVKAERTPKSPIVKALFRYKTFRKLYGFFNSKKKGPAWPSFVSHTDEENIQNIFNFVKRNYGEEKFVVTEKIDYQSATFFTRSRGFLRGKEFRVFSRTQSKGTKPDGSLWWEQVNKYDLKKKMLSENFDCTIQGESWKPKGPRQQVQDQRAKILGLWY